MQRLHIVASGSCGRSLAHKLPSFIYVGPSVPVTACPVVSSHRAAAHTTPPPTGARTAAPEVFACRFVVRGLIDLLSLLWLLSEPCYACLADCLRLPDPPVLCCSTLLQTLLCKPALQACFMQTDVLLMFAVLAGFALSRAFLLSFCLQC